MKVIMIFILTLCVLDVNAQEKQFKNFKIVPELVGEVCGYGRWIVPMDFEQVFDSLKLEYKSKLIFGDSTLLQRVSLSLWFSEVPHVCLKENADKAILEKWSKAVPETLQKRLTEYGKESNRSVYFSVQMLADCEGKVLAVYFELNEDLLSLVQEDELQAISDKVKANGFNPEDFVFAQVNNECFKPMFDSLAELQNNHSLTKEQIEQRDTLVKKLEEVIKPSIPVHYGLIICFEMSFHLDSPKSERSRHYF